MWVSYVSRKQLLDVFELQGSTIPIVVFETKQLSDLPTDQEYSLVWNKEPRAHPTLPVAVLLAPQRRTDFLAWAATYLPTVRPFTAYCRVLEKGEGILSIPETDPALGRFEESCLGLILGEATTYLNGRHDPRQLSPSMCARTYSFAMARALALGLFEWDHYSVSDEWVSLRQLTRQTELSLGFDVLDSVWSIFLSVSSGGLYPKTFRKSALSARKISEQLVGATWVLCNHGKLDTADWRILTSGFPEVADAIDEVQGTREQRVRSLDKYLMTLEKVSEREPLLAGFMAGYLTSQVSPGSFDHASLLLPHVKALTSAILWYGFSAGASREAQIGRYSSGLGRRVLRDLLRSESVFDRPKCDIAIGELAVLLRGDSNHMMDIRTSVQGILEVEIAPCVTSVVHWPSRAETIESTPNRPQQEIQRLVTDLSQALLKAENVRQRLAGLLDDPKSPDPTDKRKKKR